MKTPVRIVGAGIAGAALVAMAPVTLAGHNPVPVLPLELRQDLFLVNFQSLRGVPLSQTNNVPPGSDGRAPTPDEQRNHGLPDSPPTPGQFQTWIAFGALAAPRNTNLNTALSYAGNAPRANLDLPRGENGGRVVVIMTRALVGAPWLARNISFLFG
ncbi:MAG: hypothetical protein N2438_09765, partial [Limisphaera sp.]|nr:hypothetical protein [Limisphaera sp.]